MSDIEKLDDLTQDDFEQIHSDHWSIECYHRVIKQACNIERFQVRNENAILTHIYCALKAFVSLEVMKLKKRIKNHYQIQKELYQEVIRKFVLENSSTFEASVNA